MSTSQSAAIKAALANLSKSSNANSSRYNIFAVNKIPLDEKLIARLLPFKGSDNPDSLPLVRITKVFLGKSKCYTSLTAFGAPCPLLQERRVAEDFLRSNPSNSALDTLLQEFNVFDEWQVPAILYNANGTPKDDTPHILSISQKTVISKILEAFDNVAAYRTNTNIAHPVTGRDVIIKKSKPAAARNPLYDVSFGDMYEIDQKYVNHGLDPLEYAMEGADGPDLLRAVARHYFWNEPIPESFNGQKYKDVVGKNIIKDNHTAPQAPPPSSPYSQPATANNTAQQYQPMQAAPQPTSLEDDFAAMSNYNNAK